MGWRSYGSEAISTMCAAFSMSAMLLVIIQGSARQRVTRAGEVAVMVIDVGRANGLAQQFLEEVGFLVGGARRADTANRVRAMIISNLAQTRGQHDKTPRPRWRAGVVPSGE